MNRVWVLLAPDAAAAIDEKPSHATIVTCDEAEDDDDDDDVT